MCTFEKDESCLLTNDKYNDNAKQEMWDFVDGRGVVADNTLRRGLSIGLYTFIHTYVRMHCRLNISKTVQNSGSASMKYI